jgi:hypothetical protein
VGNLEVRCRVFHEGEDVPVVEGLGVLDKRAKHMSHDLPMEENDISL